MEKLGQIHQQAQARRELRPDRGGHPAVPVRARLPRRPRAALELPRRPVHPAAAGSGARPGPADDRRGRADHQRHDQDPRVPRCCATCRPSWPAFDTLFGGFRQRAQKTFELLQADGTAFLVVAAPEPRRAARGGVLRRAAQRGPDAAGGPRGQPREPGAGRRPVRRRGDGGCRPADASRTGRPSSGACCGCTPTARGWSSARRGCATGSPRRTRRSPPRWCRPWPATCTT